MIEIGPNLEGVIQSMLFVFMIVSVAWIIFRN